MADHPAIDDLADAAEGLLDPDRAARVSAHLGGCADCRATAAALRQVSATLAAEPAPPMPPAVAHRLDAVLAAESAHRAAAHSTGAHHAGAHPLTHPRHTLGHFHHHQAALPWWWRLAPLLAAAVAAAVVGTGGYVVSARAGLNEPPVLGVALSTTDLAAEAQQVAAERDLDPHRFSQAWLCARSATRGRITGLVGARVDGGPALLVYTRDEGASSVVVVRGCAGAAPAAVASAALPG